MNITANSKTNSQLTFQAVWTSKTIPLSLSYNLEAFIKLFEMFILRNNLKITVLNRNGCCLVMAVREHALSGYLYLSSEIWLWVAPDYFGQFFPPQLYQINHLCLLINSPFCLVGQKYNIQSIQVLVKNLFYVKSFKRSWMNDHEYSWCTSSSMMVHSCCCFSLLTTYKSNYTYIDVLQLLYRRYHL